MYWLTIFAILYVVLVIGQSYRQQSICFHYVSVIIPIS